MSEEIKQLISKLMPGIYKEEIPADELDLVLNVIASAYTQLQSKIDQLKFLYDLDNVDLSQLPYIGYLVGYNFDNSLGNVSSWFTQDIIKRSQVKNAVAWQKLKGSIYGMKQFLLTLAIDATVKELYYDSTYQSLKNEKIIQTPIFGERWQVGITGTSEDYFAGNNGIDVERISEFLQKETVKGNLVFDNVVDGTIKIHILKRKVSDGTIVQRTDIEQVFSHLTPDDENVFIQVGNELVNMPVFKFIYTDVPQNIQYNDKIEVDLGVLEIESGNLGPFQFTSTNRTFSITINGFPQGSPEFRPIKYDAASVAAIINSSANGVIASQTLDQKLIIRTDEALYNDADTYLTITGPAASILGLKQDTPYKNGSSPLYYAKTHYDALQKYLAVKLLRPHDFSKFYTSSTEYIDTYGEILVDYEFEEQDNLPDAIVDHDYSTGAKSNWFDLYLNSMAGIAEKLLTSGDTVLLGEKIKKDVKPLHALLRYIVFLSKPWTDSWTLKDDQPSFWSNWNAAPKWADEPLERLDIQVDAYLKDNMPFGENDCACQCCLLHDNCIKKIHDGKIRRSFQSNLATEVMSTGTINTTLGLSVGPFSPSVMGTIAGPFNIIKDSNDTLVMLISGNFITVKFPEAVQTAQELADIFNTVEKRVIASSVDDKLNFERMTASSGIKRDWNPCLPGTLLVTHNAFIGDQKATTENAPDISVSIFENDSYEINGTDIDYTTFVNVGDFVSLQNYPQLGLLEVVRVETTKVTTANKWTFSTMSGILIRHRTNTFNREYRYISEYLTSDNDKLVVYHDGRRYKEGNKYCIFHHDLGEFPKIFALKPSGENELYTIPTDENTLRISVNGEDYRDVVLPVGTYSAEYIADIINMSVLPHLKFSGDGDSYFPHHADVDMGTSDFSIEFMFKQGPEVSGYILKKRAYVIPREGWFVYMNSSSPQIWLCDGSANTINNSSDSIKLATGTASFTNGSTTITGTGTNFLTLFKANDRIKLQADSDDHFAIIASVDDDENITLFTGYTGSTNTGTAERFTSFGTYGDNSFHRCSITVDRDGYASCYIDGRFVNDFDVSSYSSVNLNNVMDVFMGSYPASGFWTGGIFDVRVYKNAILSSTTVRDWAFKRADSTHPNYSDLKAYYKLNEHTGFTFYNTIPTGPGAGTISSNVYWIGNTPPSWVDGNSSAVLAFGIKGFLRVIVASGWDPLLQTRSTLEFLPVANDAYSLFNFTPLKNSDPFNPYSESEVCALIFNPGPSVIQSEIQDLTGSFTFTSASDTVTVIGGDFDNEIQVGAMLKLSTDDDEAYAVIESADSGTGIIKLAKNTETSVNALTTYDGNLWAGSGPNAKFFKWNGVNDYQNFTSFYQSNITAFLVFATELYCSIDDGTDGVLYKWINLDKSWTEVARAHGSRISSIVEFSNTIYAACSNTGKLFKLSESTFIEVADTFGSETRINALAVLDNKLYAATGITGKLLQFNSFTEEWTLKADTLSGETSVLSLAIYNGKLYGGTGTFGRLYEWNGTSDWVQKAAQFGAEDKINCLAVYNGQLYGGTSPNGKLYRWYNSVWKEAANNVAGEQHIKCLIEYKNYLYAGSADGACILFFNEIIKRLEQKAPLNIYKGSTGTGIAAQKRTGTYFKYLPGTVTFTSSDVNVSGSGAEFTSHVQAGDYVKSKAHDNSCFAQVNSVTDDDNLILATAYTGATVAATMTRIRETPYVLGVNRVEMDLLEVDIQKPS